MGACFSVGSTSMRRFDAVVFDLFETLVTEFDPGWRPGPTTADRLGVPNEVFDDVWGVRHPDRMTSAVDFRDVLREACSAAGHRVDATVSRTIEDLYDERLAAKAKPLRTVDSRLAEASAASSTRPEARCPEQLLDRGGRRLGRQPAGRSRRQRSVLLAPRDGQT